MFVCVGLGSMARLDITYLRLAVASYPTQGLVACRVVGGQQDMIIPLEYLVFVRFIQNCEISNSARDRVCRIFYVHRKIHVVFISTRLMCYPFLLCYF